MTIETFYSGLLQLLTKCKQGCYDSRTKTCDWDHDCTGQKHSKKCGVSTGADLWSAKLAMEIRASMFG